jgi:hypothetical protein
MPWVRVGISSWKILRCVSNPYPCMPSVPAADYLQCTSCSGFCCDGSGLLLVTPRTVVKWHRAGFRLHWKWLCRARQVGGRRPVSQEIRALIFRMAAENPTWGAPRIHGELLKLGFQVSEPTVSRWLQRVSRTPDPAQRWLTVLRNHREALPRWISSPYRQSRLAYCTASL